MNHDAAGPQLQRTDALVVFGATGDLARKKIFPALNALCRRDVLTQTSDQVLDRQCINTLRTLASGSEVSMHGKGVPL